METLQNNIEPQTNEQEIREVVDRNIENIAKVYCPSALAYDEFKQMSPLERLTYFHQNDISSRINDDPDDIDLSPKGINKIDLICSPNVSPKALMGNHDDQVLLKETLLANGYDSIRLLERYEKPRSISISRVSDKFPDAYMFSRTRILWECQRSGGGVDYVTKRSTFVAGQKFVDEIDIDTSLMSLSPSRVGNCERLLDELGEESEKPLDERDEKLQELIEDITPHSVLYFIKNEMPDKINHPDYQDDDLQRVLQILRSQPKQ